MKQSIFLDFSFSSAIKIWICIKIHGSLIILEDLINKILFNSHHGYRDFWMVSIRTNARRSCYGFMGSLCTWSNLLGETKINGRSLSSCEVESRPEQLWNLNFRSRKWLCPWMGFDLESGTLLLCISATVFSVLTTGAR